MPYFSVTGRTTCRHKLLITNGADRTVTAVLNSVMYQENVRICTYSVLLRSVTKIVDHHILVASIGISIMLVAHAEHVMLCIVALPGNSTIQEASK